MISVIATDGSELAGHAVAAERSARMIVLGSHGWGAIKSALYGSTAAGVMRHAPCPVLMVPTDSVAE